jgi:hypothetical protein
MFERIVGPLEVATTVLSRYAFIAVIIAGLFCTDAFRVKGEV